MVLWIYHILLLKHCDHDKGQPQIITGFTFPVSDYSMWTLFIILSTISAKLWVQMLQQFCLFPSVWLILIFEPKWFRPCLDVVGFTSIHMCWSGLGWNLVQILLQSTPTHVDWCESDYIQTRPQLIVSSFSLGRMPFSCTLANLHCFVHMYHTNEYCRMKIMIDHAVVLWCTFALSVLQLPTSSSPASSSAIVLQLYLSVADCSHHTNCICSHFCMKAPGKQLYITVSHSCCGFSIQNYRQNSYMLLLS